jgi:hypothetical protein
MNEESIGYICVAAMILSLIFGVSTCVCLTDMQAAEHDFQLKKMECLEKKMS